MKRFSLLTLSTAVILLTAASLCLLPKKSVYEVADYGIYPDGSDIGESLYALTTNVQQSGGGTIQFQSGTYYSSRQMEFYATGLPPNQPNLWIRGTAPHASYSANSSPSSGTILLLNSTSGPAHIITRGFGTLKLTDITLKATNRNFIPFIKTIYSTLKLRDVMFYGSDQNPNCFEDGVVLGGDGPPDFVTGDNNASFQGYGTVIENCYFNRIRVPIRFAAHANAAWFKNNVVMNECGGTNNPWGSPVVLDSLGWGPVTGNNIEGNLIEMTGYTNGNWIGNGASMNNFIFNNYYDARLSNNPVAYFFQDCASGNFVLSGQVPVTMSLKSGNSVINQEVRTAIQGQTNDYYNISQFQNSPVRFIGQAAQPQYVMPPYAVTHRLSDNGLIWSVSNPETGGTYSDTMRMGKMSGGGWLSFYGDGYFYSANDSYFLAATGKEAFIGDHQRQVVIKNGNIISNGTNTYNADISVAPSNSDTSSGWLPVTNNGARHYLRLYQ